MKSSTMLVKARILTVHKAVASTSIFPSPQRLTDTPSIAQTAKATATENISLHTGEPENPSRYSIICRSPVQVLLSCKYS